MAIRLIEPPEPLTGASGQEKALLIESDGLRMLRQELRRYCDQKVSGRSFLVAGHRGSGKTTMVQGSIQRTEDEINAAWGELRLSRNRTGLDFQTEALPAPILRPLFILLQGPNLLPAESAEQAAASTKPTGKAAEPAPDSEARHKPEAKAKKPAAGAAPAEDPAPNPMETVLVQITLGLYRALAGEFSRAYTERAMFLARTAARLNKRAKKLSRRDLELALQFELELDQYPGVGRLHEYWRLARLLDTGVLFWNSGDPRMDPGQAYRELVALSSTCQAYQRICGKLSRKDEKSQGDETKVDAEVAMDAKGSELLKPVMALLTGGAVGAGVLAAKPGGTPIAVFAGLVTALLASVVVKYSSSRTRKEGMNRADLFIPDLSVATLDRVLPVLLNRIRRAGLAPVFVVDELDKVDLTGRITEMVKRLKKLVAENAFFCFLTDRRYFEEMLGRTLDAPYPIEYTYFTNQLFIIFRHRDLHEYLEQVLVLPSATAGSTVSSGTDSWTSIYADDRDDKQVLQYVLLHDSQMHPFDLRRQLGSLRNADGEVNLPRGEVRSPRRHYPFAISIQVAIELILDEEEMRVEIEKRPAFLQLAHDALYYISRKWSDTKLPLDLSDDTGKKCFEDYLRSRKATNTALGPKLEQDRAEEELEQERLEKLYLKVDGLTCDFLFAGLRKLANYLAEPGVLAKAAENAQRIPSVVIDALSREPLLVLIANERDRYRWTHSATGRALDRKTGVVTPQSSRPVTESKWSEDAEFISEFQKQVSELTHREVDFSALASQFGVLKTSPAWADARRAIERLQQAEGSRTPYPEQEDDLRCVRDFRQILTDGSTAMGMALACALVLSGLHPDSPATSVLWPLSVIAEAFGFRRMSPERTLNALQHFVEEFSPFSDMLNVPPVSTKESVIAWAAWVKKAGADRFKASASELESFEKEAWNYWEARLRDQVLMPEPPKLGTIVCHTLWRGPGTYLVFPVEEMRITNWTWTFFVSMAKTLEPNSTSMSGLSSIPSWMALAALQHLGFDQSTLNRFLEHLRQFDITLSPGEFPQEGTDSRNRRPAGMLICRGLCPSVAWQVAPSQPLLLCNIFTAMELMKVFEEKEKRLLEALGLSFVAFDFSRDESGLSPETAPASLEGASSSAGPRSLFTSEETAVYNFFAPNPKAPVPVMIDDPARYPGLDPRYTMTGINSPSELLAAVSAMLRPLPS